MENANNFRNWVSKHREIAKNKYKIYYTDKFIQQSKNLDVTQNEILI